MQYIIAKHIQVGISLLFAALPDDVGGQRRDELRRRLLLPNADHRAPWLGTNVDWEHDVSEVRTVTYKEWMEAAALDGVIPVVYVPIQVNVTFTSGEAETFYQQVPNHDGVPATCQRAIDNVLELLEDDGRASTVRLVTCIPLPEDASVEQLRLEAALKGRGR
jgi:hypothetical protein